ncbi:MAG: cytochrome-c peroxidase [Bacteroidia bacterium]|nr:cytochrome-c peroxidase [Bacteroidia bacterium]
MNRLIKSLGWLLIPAVFSACSVDPDLSPAPLPEEKIEFVIPQGFPQPVYNFTGNPLTTDGFKLGRKLFHDPLLSRDNSTSCESCHQQFASFAHLDHPVSHGIDNQFGTRNSPSLFNLIWHPSFMWDGGINHIEVQPIAPITNPIEMDESLGNVINKLRNHPQYPALFKKAFGSDSITTQLMLRAFAQFMGMMNSYRSKYDKYIRGEAELTLQENSGLNIFRAKCESCHKEPLFSDFSFRNNGLDDVFPSDSGRAHITSLPEDIGKFKVPSLRNVSVSRPYMHDGRLQTLSQCIDHYRFHVKPSPTLDPLLVNGITLSESEKQDLLQFLNTLTDYEFINDPRFKPN